jgi:hypothetical protein
VNQIRQVVETLRMRLQFDNLTLDSFAPYTISTTNNTFVVVDARCKVVVLWEYTYTPKQSMQQLPGQKNQSIGNKIQE